jgi:hypothetical protein
MNADWLLWPVLIVVAIPFVVMAFCPPHLPSAPTEPWMPPPSLLEDIMRSVKRDQK